MMLRAVQRASQASGGFTMLVGFDGLVRASEPDAATIGQIFPHTDILGQLKAGESGGVTLMDNAALTNYRKVTGYDLYVVAGFPRGDSVRFL